MRWHIKLQERKVSKTILFFLTYQETYAPSSLPWMIARPRPWRPAFGAFLFVARSRMLEQEAESNLPSRPKTVLPFVFWDESTTGVFIRNHVFPAFDLIVTRSVAVQIGRASCRERV